MKSVVEDISKRVLKATVKLSSFISISMTTAAAAATKCIGPSLVLPLTNSFRKMVAGDSTAITTTATTSDVPTTPRLRSDLLLLALAMIALSWVVPLEDLEPRTVEGFLGEKVVIVPDPPQNGPKMDCKPLPNPFRSCEELLRGDRVPNHRSLRSSVPPVPTAAASPAGAVEPTSSVAPAAALPPLAAASPKALRFGGSSASSISPTPFRQKVVVFMQFLRESTSIYFIGGSDVRTAGAVSVPVSMFFLPAFAHFCGIGGRVLKLFQTFGRPAALRSFAGALGFLLDEQPEGYHYSHDWALLLGFSLGLLLLGLLGWALYRSLSSLRQRLELRGRELY